VLCLSGSYTQGAAGTLTVRISATSNDFFSITGTATLGGTLIVTAQGTLPGNGEWTILTAAGGEAPPFANTTVPAGFQVAYDATTVYVIPAA